MSSLNYKFFDEFKALDAILKDVCNSLGENKLGVTLYLETMDKLFATGEAKVEGWKSDYNRLKKLRHIRNELAHSANSFSCDLCSSDDIDFVISFKERVLMEADPISLLKEASKKKQYKRKKTEPWRIIVAIISILFIAYLWITKDIKALYTTLPEKEAAPLIVTTVAVSLFKVAMITGGVFLIKWIITKIKNNH